MFAPEELADLRDVNDSALPDTCDVLRMVRVRQPNNSWEDEEQTVQSGLRCRKSPLLTTPAEMLSDQTPNTRYVTTFQVTATAAPIYADDVLLHKGKKYPVAGVADESDEMLMRVFVYDNSLPEPV